jgi:hypothetical protein
MDTMYQLSLADLAQLLFASPVQQGDRPTPAQVRSAVTGTLCTCGGDRSVWAGRVAQEAGDHPEEYQQRMRWALATVREEYRPADVAYLEVSVQPAGDAPDARPSAPSWPSVRLGRMRRSPGSRPVAARLVGPRRPA